MGAVGVQHEAGYVWFGHDFPKEAGELHADDAFTVVVTGCLFLGCVAGVVGVSLEVEELCGHDAFAAAGIGLDGDWDVEWLSLVDVFNDSTKHFAVGLLELIAKYLLSVS